ncbi:MAG TPA: ATP-binding protein [Burkholderiales bacterium]|nr:ATP-binding protein [Burkholderiales bacterium]
MKSAPSSIDLIKQSASQLLSLLQRLRPKRNDDLGREQGQTVVRTTLSVLILVYFLSSYYPFDLAVGVPIWLAFTVFFILLSVVICVAVFNDTRTSVARRTLTNIGDVAAITYLMILTDRVGIPLFVLYLWVTLGNGLRFGFRAMTTSAVLSLTGFSVVLALSPAWQQLVTVAIAVTVALIALPLYSAQLTRHRSVSPGRGKPTNAADANSATMTETASPTNSHGLSRERGQALTRLGVCSTVFVYLLVREYPITEIEPWLLFCFGYLMFSVLIVTLALVDSQHSSTRRVASNVADVVAISYLMIATGETGLPLFVLYLWITLGNGFRFGLPAMTVSGVLSIVGFSAVVAISDLWRSNLMMAAGVVAGLIVIPSYTAHLVRQLHLARRRAEDASAAKGHFLARMSHELRTPLNGILGTTDLLATSKRISREDRSLLQVIRDSVKVSMRQIDNVLDFSKIEAGRLVIERTEFDLHELLGRTVRLLRGVAVEKNVRLTLRIDPAIPFKLVGDPHHVQEVLMNLLSNAVKFTDKGYVSVDAKLSQQTNDSVQIRLEVHDTGIGIESTALSRIFEAFSQEDSGTTRRYGGTGLGTTIAKQLVELMGGYLGVISTKGRGSNFYAELPFDRSNEKSDVGNFGSLSALLISKNTALRDQMESMTNAWGVSLQTVPSATEAEGLLRRNIRVGNPVHIVFADSHAVLTNSGTHSADELTAKAASAFVPVFVLCDVAPEDAQLRQWGYAGAISYDLPQMPVFNAMHVGYALADSTEHGVVRVEPWAWGKNTRQRAKLLVADDNRTNLMILRKILETANYDVDAVENGEQALDMLLRGRYKAAILDMHMPGLDGVSVIKQYRAMRHGARTPIVMLTANATVNAKLESAEAGADAYLTKPATAANIVGTIQRLLDDTEIHEFSQNHPIDTTISDVPILDITPIAELDRLYSNPAGIKHILDEFENESRRILQGIAEAVSSKNHAAFCDLLHALKGNGANVGTLRLVTACQEAERCGLLEFRRDGKLLLQKLEATFAEAMQALRELTSTGEQGPSIGSDLN